jgi:hypothetical protein
VTKDPLPPLHPWWYCAFWDVWTYLTWPRQAREMKRMGFRRTGWMTYELGPENADG